MTKEEFIINDIDLNVSPSDVQVMDDNWVAEDSYLRSRAVYCFRSKYAATKVVLNIPFKISSDLSSTNVKDTKDCIRLIVELSNYPYCFIKNQRIKSYISPTVVSDTDFMMFAVSELTINQDASASDVVFLEVVLEFYNHASVIEDFVFKSNLGVVQGEDDKGMEVIGLEADVPCYSLAESEVWNNFIKPKELAVWTQLKEVLDWDITGFQSLYNTSVNKTYLPFLNVSIASPVIQSKVGLPQEIIDNIKSGDYKMLITTDIKEYNNGQFEKILTSPDGQNFSMDANGYQTDNLTQTTTNTSTQEETTNTQTTDSILRNPNAGKQEVLIRWIDEDLETAGVKVQALQTKMRNKLVSHRISSFKHPIIQFMGKDPVVTNVTFTSQTQKGIYNNTEDAPNYVFIKNMISLLDFNRINNPEAEAYNFLKIKSFANILLGAVESLPGQSITTGSATNQGVDTIVYSFNEGNLSSFMEETRVNKSGKRSKKKVDANVRKIILNYINNLILKVNSGKKLTANDTKMIGILANMASASIDDMGVGITDEIQKAKDTLKQTLKDETDSKDMSGGYARAKAIGSANDTYKEVASVPNNIKSIFSSMQNVDSMTQTYYVNPIKVVSPLNETTGYIVISPSLFMPLHIDSTSFKLPKKTALLCNLSIVKDAISLRLALDNGETPTRANIKYNPNGLFDSMISTAIATINNGNKLADGSVTTPSATQDAIDDIMSDSANMFFGYNLDDLDYQRLVPNYNEETDLVVANIDPFFFLSQSNILNGTELQAVYDSVYNKGEMGNTYDPTAVYNEEIKPVYDLGIHPITEEDTAEEGSTDYWNNAFNGETGRMNMPNYNNLPDAVYSKTPKGFTKEKAETIKKVAKNIGVKPNDLAAAISFETSGTFSPSIKNPNSSATGLIQFMAKEGTAHESAGYNDGSYYGLSRYQFASLSFDSQMDYVEKYFKERNKKFRPGNESRNSLVDVYGAISGEKTYYAGSKEYNKNPSWDINNDGKATVEERVQGKAFKAHIKNYFKDTATSSGVTTQAATDKVINRNVEKLSPTISEVSYSNKDKSYNRSGSPYVGKLEYIVDGDTYRVTYINKDTNKTESIRVYGIDAPEVFHEGIEGKGTNEIGGQEAKKLAEEVFKTFGNKQLKLEFQGNDAKYGRDVATVKLADDTDLAKYLLRRGLGIVPDGFIKGEGYYEAQQEAIDNKRGIWGMSEKLLSKPRQEDAVKDTIFGLTADQIEKAKSNGAKNELDSDLNNASSPKGKTYNTWVPLKDGTTYKILGGFGSVLDPTTKKVVKRSGIEVQVANGTEVIAAANGIVRNFEDTSVGKGIGKYVQIDHGNGLKTIYGYLGETTAKDGSTVKYGDTIGTIGSVSKLIYQVTYKDQPKNPFALKRLNTYKSGDPSIDYSDFTSEVKQNSVDKPEGKLLDGVTKENTVYNEDKLAKAIFDNISKYSTLGLSTSLPAIRVYITVGNENDTLFLSTFKTGVLYYELKGIKDFRLVCNSDKNPVDTCTMYVANPSHLNTDAYSSLNRMPTTIVDKIGTDMELQYINDRAQLRPGTKIHVRLGYGNNPNELEPVFSGSIVEVDNSRTQTLGIVCSGYGKELVNDILAPSAPEWLNNSGSNSSTSTVIAASLASKAINHFGFVSSFVTDKLNSNTDTDPDAKKLVDKISWSNKYFINLDECTYKSRRYLNCFTKFIERVEPEFNKYIGWASSLWQIGDTHMGGYPFPIYKQTPWEIMKQAEYRHPGTIVKPMLYEDHMSLFHGIKEQFYFYKDLPIALQTSAAQGDKGSKQTYYTRRTERFKPVSNIHIATSSTNIINNGISINSTYNTQVAVSYIASKDKNDTKKPWEQESIDISADDNLASWELRKKYLYLSGCVGKYSAFLFGTQELKKEAEKMYSGNIRLLGNPTIKVGDYVFIDDADQRLLGLFLVRECNHLFTEQHGYVTDIVPGQYVEPAMFMHSTLWTKIALTCKAVTPKMMLYSSTNYSAKEFNMVTQYLTLLSRSEATLQFYQDEQKLTHRFPELAAYTSAAMLGFLGAYSTVKLFTGVTAGIGGGKYWTGRGVTKFTIGLVSGALDASYYEMVRDKLKGKYPSAIPAANEINAALTNKYNATKARVLALTEKVKNTKTAAAMKELIDSRKALKLAEKGWIRRGLEWTGRRGLDTVKFATKYGLFKALRALSYAGIMMLGVAGLYSILLDIVAFVAIKYITNKMEEEKMIRQPLMFYPLVKNGKPYVGGITGAVRNEWWDSQKLEMSRTMQQINRASSILAPNANISGNTALGSVFGWVANKTETDANLKSSSLPIFMTDANGKAIINKTNNDVLQNWKQKDDPDKKEDKK